MLRLLYNTVPISVNFYQKPLNFSLAFPYEHNPTHKFLH